MRALQLIVALPERQPGTVEAFILDEMAAAAKTLLTWHDNLDIRIVLTPGEGTK